MTAMFPAAGCAGARRYAEPVNVRRLDDGPEQFVWRHRLYVVQTVLAHWMQAGRWWLTPGGLDVDDREVWRVEAAPGRTGPRGSYDLCLDRSSGDWSVTRVHD